VLLVKPQFEAGRDRVGRGGVVRDPEVWGDVLGHVAEHVQGLGRRILGIAASPLRGPAGNVEFLLHVGPGRPLGAADLARLIGVAVDEGRDLAVASEAKQGVDDPNDSASPVPDAAQDHDVPSAGPVGVLARGRS